MSIKKISQFCMIFFLLVILSACDSLFVNRGEAPVFRGMEITTSSITNDSMKRQRLNDQFNQQSTDNEEWINDTITDAFDLESNEIADYFATPSTEVLLSILLDNPDGQAILRFTLNDVVYQSFQFEAGSTSEKLVLKVTTPNDYGVYEYTIDEIKFVENGTNDIKDVIFEGNPTIKLGISSPNHPVVQDVLLEVYPTRISMNFNISDVDQITELNNQSIKLFIFDREELLITRELELGNNQINIDKLVSGEDYQVVIAAAYDIFDGTGTKVNILYESNTLQTTPIATLHNENSTVNNISFDIIINDQHNLGSISKIELFKEDILIDTLDDLSEHEFKNLLSNSDYTVKVSYNYDLNDGKGSRVFEVSSVIHTLSENKPLVTVHDVTTTKTSILFDIEINDLKNLGNVSKIELFSGSELIYALNDLSLREFSNLLSNHLYTVVVTYDYDLNDGQGINHDTYQLDVTTLPKEEPIIIFNDIVSTESTISFNLEVTDVDNIGYIDRIELLKNDEIVRVLPSIEDKTFSGLLSNNEYSIKVIYTYDLNDNLGIREKIELISYRTKSKSAPLINIFDITSTQDSLKFSIALDDIDNVGTISKIELYKDNDLMESLSNVSLREFKNLVSNQMYTIKVTIDYDLNDGLGIVSTIESINVKTKKRDPIITFMVYGINQSSASWDIYFYDVDNSLVSYDLYANVYKSDNGNPVFPTLTKVDLNGQTGGSLNELDSGNVHRIVIDMFVDYGDGAGPVIKTEYVEFSTPKKPSNYMISQNVSTSDSLMINLWELNEDVVYTKDLKFELYNSDKTTLITDDFDDNPDMLFGWISEYVHTFSGLISNTIYKLVISYSADLLDGNGEQIFVYEYDLKTNSKAVPSISFLDIVQSFDSISFNIEELDVDDTGDIQGVSLHLNGQMIETLPKQANYKFDNLLTDTQYEIFVQYEYDLNDGNGPSILTERIRIYTSIAEFLDSYDIIKANIMATIVSINQMADSYRWLIEEDNRLMTITQIPLNVSNYNVGDVVSMEVVRDVDSLTGNVMYILTEQTLAKHDNYDPYGYSFPSLRIETFAYTIPAVALNNELIDIHSIAFNLELNDSNMVIQEFKVELFNNGNQQEILNNQSQIVFDNLLSNTSYTVRVTIFYDLNDGLGSQFYVIENSYITLPESISITSNVIMNSSALAVGDVLNLKLNILNPSNAKVEYFVINGNNMMISGLNGITTALMLLTIEDTGIQQFVIDGYKFVGHDQIFSMNSTVIEIVALKDIELLKVYNEYNALSISEDSYVYLDIKNIQNYYIESITVQYGGFGGTYTYISDEIIWVDHDTVKILYNGSMYMRPNFNDYSFEYVNVKSIGYGFDSTHIKEKTIPVVYGGFLPVYSYSIRTITTPEQLQNMESGYVYQLDADIDLSSFNWTPYSVKNVLLGNNHSISGLTLVTLQDNPYNVITGLFSHLSGVIMDLEVKDFYIYTNSALSTYVGLLAGRSYYTITSNVKVSGNNTIVANGDTLIVGSLYGIIESSVLRNITISGHNEVILSASSNLAFGGAIGGNYGREINQVLVEATIQLTINSYSERASIGGVVGSENGGHIYNTLFKGHLNIQDNDADQSGYLYVGGIVARHGNDVMYNIFSGEMSIITSSQLYYGGITIEPQTGIDMYNLYAGTTNITNNNLVISGYIMSTFYQLPENNFVTFDSAINVNNQLVTKGTILNVIGPNDLNDVDFYVQMMQLSDTVWLFENLDYTNKIIPTLINPLN